MSDAAFLHLDRMESLIYELEQHWSVVEHTRRAAKDLIKRYQAGMLDYLAYNERISKVYEGKGRDSWAGEQDRIMRNILDKIEFFNKQVFFRIYSEEQVVHVIEEEYKPMRRRKKQEKPIETVAEETAEKMGSRKDSQDFEALFAELEK